MRAKKNASTLKCTLPHASRQTNNFSVFNVFSDFFIESITQLEVLATEATFNVVVQILQNSTNSAFCDNDTLYGFCIPFNSVVVEHFMKFSTVEANSFNWTIEGLEKHTTYTCVFELRNGTGTTSYEKITDITFTTSETDGR